MPLHTVTLRLERVFDVQKIAHGNELATLFSFESNGKRYLSVCVEGTPKLAAGQTISAVLGQPDNWQTLEGMRIHETNEVFAPTASGWAGLLAITLFFTAVRFYEQRFSRPQAVIPVTLILTAICVYFCHLCLKSIRIKRALLNAQ